MAWQVERRLVERGVDVHAGVGAERIEDGKVMLSDGSVIDADLVVAAIGVHPESLLASKAGLVVGDRSGIVVDDAMRTSQAHIYAVGDAVEKHDAVSGAAALVPLAQTANRHGRLVADVITGRTVAAPTVLGTACWWTRQPMRSSARRASAAKGSTSASPSSPPRCAAG